MGMRKACHKGAITCAKARGWDKSVLWDAGWVMGPQSFPALIVCLCWGGFYLDSGRCVVLSYTSGILSRVGWSPESATSVRKRMVWD